MKFRKKPVVIEAVQYTGGFMGWHDIRAFAGRALFPYLLHPEEGVDVLYIDTLEGRMRAEKGDWIIKGVAGEFYPCKSDIFEKTYEKVEE